jgi:hypothetical protein
MVYVGEIYSKMRVTLDPTDDYFDVDSRFMALEGTRLNLPSGKFCDLGCGRGAILRRLCDHPTRCGTDFNSGAVESEFFAWKSNARPLARSDVGLPESAIGNAVSHDLGLEYFVENKPRSRSISGDESRA